MSTALCLALCGGAYANVCPRAWQDTRTLNYVTANLALDVYGGVHQVAYDAHGLVVDARVVRLQHLYERGQRAALHYLVLVVLVLEGQRPQRARRCSLHLHIDPHSSPLLPADAHRSPSPPEQQRAKPTCEHEAAPSQAW